MANVIINDQYLTDIASAIREKNGTENTYKPRKMAAAILELDTSGGGGSTGAGELKLSNLAYINYKNAFVDMLARNPDLVVKFRNVTNFDYAFGSMESTITDLSPYPVIYRNSEELYTSMNAAFAGYQIVTLMDITKDEVESTAPIYCTDMKLAFQNAQSLTTIPESWVGVFDYSQCGRADRMFDSCTHLRTIPKKYLKDIIPQTTSTQSQFYYRAFRYCYCLDEVRRLPASYGENISMSSNMFSDTFTGCNRLKSITFDMPEKVPVIAYWTNQTIQLGSGYNIGYSSDSLSDYYGMPAESEVTDEASYQALKDTADWWTRNVNYSRYNHDSAVETINSLPDTTDANGRNTIIFEALSGTLTDGGAVGNLTEEEIAVATAKGWTVSLT